MGSMILPFFLVQVITDRVLLDRWLPFWETLLEMILWISKPDLSQKLIIPTLPLSSVHWYDVHTLSTSFKVLRSRTVLVLVLMKVIKYRKTSLGAGIFSMMIELLWATEYDVFFFNRMKLFVHPTSEWGGRTYEQDASKPSSINSLWKTISNNHGCLHTKSGHISLSSFQNNPLSDLVRIRSRPIQRSCI